MRKRLGQLLLDAGVIDQAQLRAALAEQQRWGRPLGETLVAMRLADETALVEVLSKHLGMESVNLDKVQIPDSVLKHVPRDLAVQHRVIPFAQPMKFLDIAMFESATLAITDELRLRTRLNIRPFLAGPKMIDRALTKYYGHGVPADLQIALSRTVTKQDEIRILQERVSKLESQLERDEQIIRKLVAFLVDKGIATREEIIARLG